MRNRYLMGKSDGLKRTLSEKMKRTTASDRLRRSLISAAIDKAVRFYVDFFNADCEVDCTSDLAEEYEKVYAEAKKLSLMESGGISEKDHLNLWCLGKVLQPKHYVESGVFIGSSFHALLSSGAIDKIVGIDPNLEKLRIPPSQLQRAQMIDDKDFSELEFPDLHFRNLVYFDDHINAAKRIIEAHEKGFKYLLIDDATGFEGICQRLYPAVPTVPMLMNPEIFAKGDTLSWSFEPTSKVSLKKIKNLFWRRNRSETAKQRVALEITPDFIALCENARGRVHRVEKLPELGDFIYQEWPGKSIDTTKFIIELCDQGP